MGGIYLETACTFGIEVFWVLIVRSSADRGDGIAYNIHVVTTRPYRPGQSMVELVINGGFKVASLP